MKKLSLLAVSLFLAGTAHAQIQPFTWVDGDLRDSAQNPVLDANVTIKATIKVNSCEVFAETHVKDLSNTNGHYAIKLGQGSPVHSTNSFSTAMDPTKGANCYPSGVTSNGIRTLTIQATLSNSDVITVPAFELGFAPSTTGVPEYLQTNSLAAPYHKFLNTAGTYGVQVNAPSGLTANYMLTLPNDVGTYGQVLTTDGTGVLSWSTPSGSPISALTSGAGINITNSAGNYTISSTTTGTVTSVSSANSDLSVATSATTPVLTLNTGTGANQILKLTSGAEIPVVSGANLTNLNANMLSVGTIPTARMPGFVGDVTSTPGTLNLTLPTVAVTKGGTGSTSFAANKLVASNGTGSALVSTNCNLNEVISFDAGGQIACQTVSALMSGVSISTLQALSNSPTAYGSSGILPQGALLKVKNSATIDNSASSLAFEVNNSSATLQRAWVSAVANNSGYAPTIALGSMSSVSTYQEYMRVTPNGVGIGTAIDPIFNLQVKNVAGGSATIGIDRPAGAMGSVVYTTNSLKRWTAGVIGNTESGSNVGSAYAITSYEDSGVTATNRLTIERSTGSVGIGTSTPMAQLDVVGTVRFGQGEGTSIRSMGVCKVTSGNFTASPANFTCTGLPGTVDIAISCSPNQAIGATLIQCRATGTADGMSCWASGTANSIGVSCMWMRTQ